MIRRLAADLNIPVDIAGVPTVRDGRGLALSSRNAYLGEQDYETATRLNQILFRTAGDIRSGTPWAVAMQAGQKALEDAGFDSLDYFEVADAHSLTPPMLGQTENLRVLAAVRLGRTRLIDNVEV